jgi:hypothetical protein
MALWMGSDRSESGSPEYPKLNQPLSTKENPRQTLAYSCGNLNQTRSVGPRVGSFTHGNHQMQQQQLTRTDQLRSKGGRGKGGVQGLRESRLAAEEVYAACVGCGLWAVWQVYGGKQLPVSSSC